MNLHEPYAENNCSTCHDPHATDNRALLRKRVGDLCADCHELQNSKAKSTHEPFVGGDCLSCHLGHGSKHQNLLTETPGALCFQCHEKEEYTQGRVLHLPAFEAQCLECHGPHSSDQMHLKRKKEKELTGFKNL